MFKSRQLSINAKCLSILLRVILRFPAFQLFQAKKAHSDIRAVIRRRVDEASLSHLWKRNDQHFLGGLHSKAGRYGL